jgi:hypothetical protein
VKPPSAREEEMTLNRQLSEYFDSRCFKDEGSAGAFFTTAFKHRKRLYFDEVENANVWSFYLIDRDLHHTFEEYLLNRGVVAPYAIWSRPERETGSDDIGRATFPIAETAAMYRRPVPKAGESLDYVLEILHLGDKSAVLGFLGFRVDLDGNRHLTPSVAAAWLRIFVKYSGDDRHAAPIPASLRKILFDDRAKSGFDWSV